MLNLRGVVTLLALGAAQGARATASDSLSVTLDNPLGASTTVEDIVTRIFHGGRNIVFVIVPIIIVFGAFQMLFSQGNPENFAKGQKTIMFAVIGLIVVLLAQGVVAIVRSILGV